MKKDLLSVYDLQVLDFELIFEKAKKLKKMLRDGHTYAPLKGKTLGMIFDKPSTRTRISFEVGMYQLGGMAVFLSSRDTQSARGESIADTARIMSRYLDGIMIRTYSQSSVEEFAGYATIPVINGLTDLLHPCQILSDLFTIIEKKGTYENLKIAYVGDGNNIANSWINAAARLPFHLALACPEGYEPDTGILERGRRDAERGVTLYRNPCDVVRDADVVYTDVWASMGQEAEREERAGVFKEYQINRELLRGARRDVIVMHCLPAHRGEEIAAEVIDGPYSVVFDQAENRLHVQKAILEILLD
ncbi:MAG: ornithine carbamoyltransferase [Syntrophaceae bacterium CG2_30_49_12]|nr:MAG: ornithine carbamoyltransferase [Syntrophaceae bacterium CG2_30_49_12]PJA48392.1 MAG: ornithine carbamoyltransferase [Syntrophobacterales bacterium CG_4_9_14_3_um_filter_49_8]PJC75787.1 MAG: ornithine carbamoyltransferase [Syntrophobacterales bacterium CG_4_8_14_3_um_filter_49_14]